MQQKLTSLRQQIEQHLAGTPGTYSIELVLPDLGMGLRHNPIVLPSASLIKVFIMAEAFHRASIGCLDLSDSAEVTPTVRVGGAGPLEHAAYGTSIKLLELIELMITESDNTATNILIRILGMDSVNKLAYTIGCHNTLLGRHMMDFTARAAGRDNFTSPTDMNILLGRLYANDCINPDSSQAMLAILLRQTDKCKLPLLLPPGTVIAHKTGELDGIEHDSGIIYGQTPYILTIMTENLPNEEQGRQTIAELSRIVYEALQ
ncbi:MAG: per1 [Anaerosporomusa subterranea]|jgi:beta-lactamase class A|nr:per1 [Anaerosporomusa subterranea]